jgi:predicted Fe-Mo cluster-binding NifX family protein
MLDTGQFNFKSIKNLKRNNNMKIAISSTGKDLESEVDIRFGRCPYFLIAEIENKEIKNVKVIENTASTQMGGAGISAAEIVANEKVEAIITTNLGPRAFSVFRQLEIEIYQGQGKIKDVIQQFIDGKLIQATNSTGPQQRGSMK